MKGLFSILGLLGMLPGLYILSLMVRGGAVTGWAWAWMLIYVLVTLGLFWLQTEIRRARFLLGFGLALLGIVVALRSRGALTTALGSQVTLPAGTPGRFINRLGEEADLGMMLYIAFSDVGAIHRDSAARARPSLRSLYRSMRVDTDYAAVPSPLPSNVLSMGSPDDFEALIFNPPPEGRAARSIVYLHGYGGQMKLPCWMLARRMPDALVVCPTVGLRGEWAHERAQAIFSRSIDYARQRSQAVYAVGQSSGATGLLHFINRRLVGHVDGVALISGFDENYYDDLRRASIPVLILHGQNDARTPPFRVEGLANVNRVRNIEMPGGEFLLYEHQDECLEELDSFCGAH